MKKIHLLAVIALVAFADPGISAETPAKAASEFEAKIRASFDAGDPVPTEIFKIRDKVEVHYFAPSSPREPGNNPALVYIHGGGWKGGKPAGTYRWCRYLAEHGVSAFTVRYKLANEKLGIKPDQCLKDAKTAMRWVRANAKKFGINPDRIAANGNSAGGHLSSALATIDGFNDSADDLSVSCRPNLLLLTSPVLDNGPGSYGNGHYSNSRKTNDYRVAEFWEGFSPLHNLNNELPDTVVLMGDNDPFISIEAVGKFGQGVRAAGSEFKWWVFPGKGHGLNTQRRSYLTPELMHIYYAYHSFLARQGYMDPPLPAGDEVRTLVRKQTLGMADSGRPNLVVIFADDLGYGDIGAYRELYKGTDDKPTAYRHTPNLDRLAQQGIRCTRAYACSWCAPSRQMLLSGQWANRSTAYDHPWVGSQLRQAGYVTGMVGKSHGSKPTQRVFKCEDRQAAEFDDGLFFNGGMRDYYMKAGETLPGRKAFESFTFKAGGGEYITDVFTGHALDFIGRNAGDPFMLYLPYTAPHTPLQGKPDDLRKLFPKTFAAMSDEEIMATAKPKEDKPDMVNYHHSAMVHALDRGVGLIMQALRDKGVADNTVVIFTSDNGGKEGSNYPLSGHKWDDLEGGIRVPFIVWSDSIANSRRSGAVYDGLVSLADIAPTLVAQTADRPYAHATDGIDLMPYVTGRETPPNDRRYFWANTSKKSFLTGFDDFYPEGSHTTMDQSVLIQDEEKILRWSVPGSDHAGVRYTRLPNAVGKANPTDLVGETPPVAGDRPQGDAGEALFREWEKLTQTDNTIMPDWSGVPTRKQKAPGRKKKKK